MYNHEFSGSIADLNRRLENAGLNLRISDQPFEFLGETVNKNNSLVHTRHPSIANTFTPVEQDGCTRMPPDNACFCPNPGGGMTRDDSRCGSSASNSTFTAEVNSHNSPSVPSTQETYSTQIPYQADVQDNTYTTSEGGNTGYYKSEYGGCYSSTTNRGVPGRYCDGVSSQVDTNTSKPASNQAAIPKTVPNWQNPAPQNPIALPNLSLPDVSHAGTGMVDIINLLATPEGMQCLCIAAPIAFLGFVWLLAKSSHY